MFNPDDAPTSVEVAVDGLPSRGWLIDLRGRPVTRVEGPFALRAGGIATIRLDG